MQHLFDEIKTYVRFGPEDEAALRALGPRLTATFPSIVDHFYERIAEHPEAAASITGGNTQRARLRASLQAWLERFFAGPWDYAYCEQRAQIGRRHVQVGLDQHYMLTALALVRERLCREALQAVDRNRDGLAGVTAINKLCDIELAIILHSYRDDSQRRLQASERLATFGELTSSICHELRNPLGVVESSTFILRRRVTGDERALEHVERIHRQVRRSMKIISSMLDIVRNTPVNANHLGARTLAERALAQFSEERQRSVELLLPEAQPIPGVLADFGQSLQVLGNLLHNAADASGESGQIRLRVEPVEVGEAPMVRFLVSDSGPGVDPSIVGRLFEPLVTTKESGVGLGLALSRKLAVQQGGALTLVSGELAGAGFAFDLPVHAAPES